MPETKPSDARRKPHAGSRHQPERTRQAILEAAIAEFAAEGVAGARIDAIARAAGVNKALLYYYFKDKEALLGAVLDRVFSGLAEAMHAQLERDLPPREMVLACAAAHFDFIASSPFIPRVVMHEMVRGGRNGSPHLRRIVEQHFRPTFGRLGKVIQEGVAAGEFRPVDPHQFIPSMVALNVFYFASSPVTCMITGADPLSPERVRARRAAVLDLISAALFSQTQPQHAKTGRVGDPTAEPQGARK